jgi:hypothetical protein
MLKKTIITGAAALAAAVAATIGTAGVAYAGDFDPGDGHADHGSHSHDGSHGHEGHGHGHDHGREAHGHGHEAHGAKNSPDCSSHEKTTQVNKGKQVVGNIVAKHIDGVIAGSIEKPGVCPSIANNNSIH